MSYRQVLETRQRGLTELEVSAILHQLLVEISKYHAVGQTHGDLSLDTLWRDVLGELYMNPPINPLLKSGEFRSANPLPVTPRSEVATIAQIAIELLTAQPISPHWQRHCALDSGFAAILHQAWSDRSANAPQNADQFLKAFYCLKYSAIPVAPIVPKQTLRDKLGNGTIELLNECRQFAQTFIKTVSILLVLMFLGWLAYNHISTLIENRPKPDFIPTPTPQPTPIEDPKSPRKIVIPPVTDR